MDRLSFENAASHVSAVDPQLEAILRVVRENAHPTNREALCFYRATYSFRSYIVKEGRPLTPAGLPLPDNLKVAGELPFGVIITKSVEVIDDLIRGSDLVEMPQALLGVSKLIGAFELIDNHLDVAGPIPDWSISSGARSLRFVDFPTQEVQWRRLRSRYPGLPRYHVEDTPNLRESELIDLLQEYGGCTTDWRTEVLFFDPAWFREIDKQLNDAMSYVPAMEVLAYFKDAAWESLARVRDRAIKLEDAINEWGGDNSAQHCKAAYLMLRYAMDIVIQRRPCFVPQNGSNELGPIDVVQTQLLDVAKLNPTVLGPSYINPGQAGFVSLSQLMPLAFVRRPEESLEQIFSIIGRAKRNTDEAGIFIPGLSNADELFGKLAFRVRTGRDRSAGRHGSVSTFRVNYNRSGKFRRAPMTLRDFYDPYFSDSVIPLSDSRFFRVAMKVDLRSI